MTANLVKKLWFFLVRETLMGENIVMTYSMRQGAFFVFVLHTGLVITIIVCFVSIDQNLDDHMLK